MSILRRVIRARSLRALAIALAASVVALPVVPATQVGAASAVIGDGFKAVSAGGSHTCVIQADDTVACWGSNVDGQSDVPAGTATAISAGWWDTCVIRPDETVDCWGYDGSGQSSPPDGAFAAISAGGHASCGIRTNGTVTCWGADGYGAGEDPVGIFSKVSAGGDFACAIREADGGLVCWGSNSDGQQSVPAGSFTSVSAESSYACATRAAGTVVCWGYDWNGQHAVPAGVYTTVSGGWSHACALRQDGSIGCWGASGAGRTTPPVGSFSDLSVGGDHACARAADGTVQCWGKDGYAQVSAAPLPALATLPSWTTDRTVDLTWTARDGIAAVASFDVQTRPALPDGSYGPYSTWLDATTASGATWDGVPGTVTCFSIRARDGVGRTSGWESEACVAIPTDDSSLTRSAGWTTATDAVFYEGSATTTTTEGATLVLPHATFRWVAVLATTCPDCGSIDVFLGPALVQHLSLVSPVRRDHVWLPVIAYDDELYDLDADDVPVTIKATSSKSVTIDGLMLTPLWAAPSHVDDWNPPEPAQYSASRPIEQVEAGYLHTCALDAAGAAICWGYRSHHVLEADPGPFTTLVAGTFHTCGLRSDGAIDCWGWGDWGQVVSKPGPYTAVAASSGDTCAIRMNGTVECWGYSYGDYGSATIPSGAFKSITGGGDTMCGIRTNDTLECWADGWAPTPPPGTFTDVFVTGEYGCAITTGGDIQCFGESYGEWPDPPAGAFKDVVLGWGFGCALHVDGHPECWGDDTFFESSPPDEVFTALSAGMAHACGTTEAGSFACWGQNREDEVAPAPTAEVGSLPLVTLGPSLHASWTGRPVFADIASYEVRYRQAAWNGRFGSYATWLDATTATSGDLPVVAGNTYCLAADATDTDGLTSHLGKLRCSTVPLDDRSLTASKGWTKLAATRYYRSTAITTKRTGATLVLSGARYSKIDLVATTCPTCGSVAVYDGKWKLRTISLKSATTRHQQVIKVDDLGWPTTGKVTIKVVSSGRKVIVDGIALSLDPNAAFASTASAAARREAVGIGPTRTAPQVR